MPEPPFPKPKSHPWHENKAARMTVGERATPLLRASEVEYAELTVTSNYTFLVGASHPEEYVQAAALMGHAGIAITDDCSVGGIVRGHVEAKDKGVPFIVGSQLTFLDPEAAGLAVVVYPTDRASYGCLCRLLTVGKRRAPKGECHLRLHDLTELSAGLLAIILPPHVITDNTVGVVQGLQRTLDDDRLSLGVWRTYDGRDDQRLGRAVTLADHTRIPLVAVNRVLTHAPERRPLQDVLTCIRHTCSLDQAGLRLQANAERHLKSPQEMARLFSRHPEAIARTVRIAHRAAGFSLDQLKYEYPDEVVPPGTTPASHLAGLTWAGAASRYPTGIPGTVRDQINHELTLIGELRYEPYFLTVHDIVHFARSRHILCQGRGAAANSAVCYCLGVTSVDPGRISVLFERFISKERNEPPDIDIDFEHERREEVIQYLYAKYGRERAALTAEVISYRSRSSVRDVGKALGLSLDMVDRLAKNMDWWDDGGIDESKAREMGLNPRDPTVRRLAALTAQIHGFPRHRSQHVGGFIISRGPLCESVPIENAAMDDRTIVEWDKDDIDAVGMLKVDCLGLGMLTAIRKSFELVDRYAPRADGLPTTLANVPPEEPEVYDMICKADTIGVFQIESRAQMSMLPRLRPRCYYDLVIEVAIVRPGPIQGNMVHPYLRRRSGEEPVTYPNPAVEKVLGRTLGVPLFQEQAMSLAIVAAGFTAGEADQLRRAMAAWKRKGDLIYRFGQKLVDGMLAKGYSQDFADRCFEQIKGFSEYGFPESHAASFALLVYVSSWLKHRHPAAFAAALINSQPMGFYAPAQIVRDAREHGVEVRPVDVNHGVWNCTLEPAAGSHGGLALRLGMRLARGLSQVDADRISAAVKQHGPYASPEHLWRASGCSAVSLRLLGRADAFGSMGLDRQRALWSVRALRDVEMPIFDGVLAEREPQATNGTSEPVPSLPAFSAQRQVTQDYGSTGLSLKAHPVSFLRDQLTRRRVQPASVLRDPARTPHGAPIAVAGVVLVRQRPGTAAGVVFMTIEDESGVANLIFFPQVFDRFRRIARHAGILIARGTVERSGEVVHVKVVRVEVAPAAPEALAIRSRDFH